VSAELSLSLLRGRISVLLQSRLFVREFSQILVGQQLAEPLLGLSFSSLLSSALEICTSLFLSGLSPAAINAFGAKYSAAILIVHAHHSQTNE